MLYLVLQIGNLCAKMCQLWSVSDDQDRFFVFSKHTYPNGKSILVGQWPSSLSLFNNAQFTTMKHAKYQLKLCGPLNLFIYTFYFFFYATMIKTPNWWPICNLVSSYLVQLDSLSPLAHLKTTGEFLFKASFYDHFFALLKQFDGLWLIWIFWIFLDLILLQWNWISKKSRTKRKRDIVSLMIMMMI